MSCRLLAAAAIVLALAGRTDAQTKFTVKAEDAPPPNELSAPVRALLDAKALSVIDADGKPLGTVWPRKALEAAKATAEQFKTGFAYNNLEETAILGAVRFAREWTDFRKQKVPAGVYTLRLSIQPMDGDHMGTAPYNEFCLLSSAKEDAKPEAMDPKALHDLSKKSIGLKHPVVMLLFPNPMPAEGPAVEEKPNDIWVLNFRRPVGAGGQKGVLGLGLVIAGVSMAE